MHASRLSCECKSSENHVHHAHGRHTWRQSLAQPPGNFMPPDAQKDTASAAGLSCVHLAQPCLEQSLWGDRAQLRPATDSVE